MTIAFEQLYGENAGTIMAVVTDTIRQSRVDNYRQIIDAYRVEAISGNYANLIEVSRRVLEETLGIETQPYDPTTTWNGIPKEWLRDDNDLDGR